MTTPARHPMRPIALLLLAVALGCSDDPTAPGPYGEAIAVSATPIESPKDDVQRIYAAIFDRNLLEIFGRIVTPDPCFSFSAYRTIRGREVHVTVVATRFAPTCPSSVDHFDYDVLSDYPSCPHLIVSYHFEGGDTPDIVVHDEDTGPCFVAAAAKR